jgi:hypothetical protein
MKDLVGPVVAAGAVGVGILQYRATSQEEFLKPVREAQLELYREASSAAAQIAILPRESADRTKAQQNFLTLYYGPLAIVEDFHHAPPRSDDKKHDDDGKTLPSVEQVMILFKKCMDDEPKCNSLGANLQNLSLALAHTCRESLGRSWGQDFPQLEGDYQVKAIEYQKQLEAAQQGQKIAK